MSTPISDNVKSAARAASATVREHIAAGDTSMTQGEEDALVALANAAMAGGYDPAGALYDAVGADGARNPLAERHRVV